MYPFDPSVSVPGPDTWSTWLQPVCVCVCMNLCSCLLVFCRVNKAQSQPRQKRMPVSRPSFDYPEDSNGGWNPSAASSSHPSAGELVLFIYIRLHKNMIQHTANVLSHMQTVNLTAFLRWTFFDFNLISSGSHNLNDNNG